MLIGVSICQSGCYCPILFEMQAAERHDWNAFKQIFFDHWDGFKVKHPEYDTDRYNGLVENMLNCGNPESMGHVEYLCTSCGRGRRLVSMSCKSSLCLRCGKVYVDNWVSQVSKMLHVGVVYRHIVLTVPEVLRRTFFDSDHLLGAFMRCGVSCMDDFYSTTKQSPVQGGYIVVLQTNSRNGEYNPHLHIIATSGGLSADKSAWIHLGYLPYKVLHKKWQWYLLEMLKKESSGVSTLALVDACYRDYPKGFVANVQKGDVPGRYNSLARYLAKYVVSPPISVKRIDRYANGEVTYHYRSHKTKRVEHETISVYRFIGRMIQHVLPKGFQRIRHYGVQATRTFAKVKGIIHSALSKVGALVQDGIRVIARKGYRERYKAGTGVDPVVCPHCGEVMDVWRIWHPNHGIIYDALEKLKRGCYGFEESKIAGGGGDRRSLRSPAEGIQLSLSFV